MNIAILGHGTVGRGVDQIVSERVEGVDVTRILELPDRLSDARMTASFDDILADSSIEVVVECMGGLEPAHTYIMAALEAGKSVVTSNKAVVAAYFAQFAAAAERGGASLFVEASVGGGIPWIASIEKVRRIDVVSSFSGIMNGTTNYIVDAMLKNDADFDEILAEAQRLGYAERDPSADIDGIDVRNKTIVTVGVAFDTDCRKDIPTTGIRMLRKSDLDLFARHGRTIKLLSRATCADGRYAAAVEPVAVPISSLEAQVPGNFNLVTLDASTVGELKFYGQGAGMLPTGNAMVQDVLDYRAGRRPHYDLSRGLAWDASLLQGDYVLRSSVCPDGAESFDEGAWLVCGVDCEQARAIYEDSLTKDPTSFMASLPKEA